MGGYLLFQVMALIGTIQLANCSKVLMVPFNHKSHLNIFTNLGKTLIDDGHEVWILAPSTYDQDIQMINAKPLVFFMPPEADINTRIEKYMKKDPSGKLMMTEGWEDEWTEFGDYCHLVLSNEDIMGEIEKQNFDLIIMDGSIGFNCMYTLPYKYGIAFITLHAMHSTSWSAGVTGMPSVEPNIILPFSNKMNILQRFINLLAWLWDMNDPITKLHEKSKFIQRYVPDKPVKGLKDIQKDSEMFLLNYDVMCTDYPRVSAPNYQFLGSSTVTKPKPLPVELETFVQGADQGVVIMTMGTFKAYQYVWRLIRKKIFTAFSKLEQRVIVQYSLDEDIGEIPDNIKVLKWLPQNDLLGHPNVKLFVTHGGNNGQNEAVYHGVPMLVIPISIDQPYAGARAIDHGFGKYVEDKEAITAEELLDHMQEILSNASYAEKIQWCSRIVKKMPTAQEKFVFWVNHIIEFGGSHLRPPSLDMPLYQMLMLDIVVLCCLVGLLALTLMVFTLYCCCRCVVKCRKVKQA